MLRMKSTEHRKNTKHAFGSKALAYVSSSVHARGEDLERLLAIARPQQHSLVLDVATGGGHTALMLAPRVGRIVATDISREMLEAARDFIIGKNICNVTFTASDAEALTFGDETFDMIVCRIAPHHFTNCRQFLLECERVLRRNGRLLVQDHVLPENERIAWYVEAFEKTRDPSHHRAYTECEWRMMMEAAGFSVVHTECLMKEHRFESWVDRQNCPPDILKQLTRMMQHIPETAADWMRPEKTGMPEATFINHHIIIEAIKSNL